MASVPGDTLVLVTGASGFIATHIVQQLQQEGYRVRGTVRSLQNEEKIKPLRNLCPDAKFPLELVEADLMKEEGWKEAVRSCTYVLHTASPVCIANPSDENDIIQPAVHGTLTVLKAVQTVGGVQRVVLTSSVAAVSQGYDIGGDHIFTEDDWTALSQPDLRTYYKSKTTAEKTAWDFVKGLAVEDKFELSVVNPSLALGPVLRGGYTVSSLEIPKSLMEQRFLKNVLPLNFAVVDVRDVALAHIRAMRVAEAAGKRHIISTENMWMKEMAEIIDAEFQPQGYKIGTGTVPTSVLRIASIIDKDLRSTLKAADKVTKLDNTRMREVLQIVPRPVKEGLLEMCYSMIELGHITKSN